MIDKTTGKKIKRGDIIIMSDSYGLILGLYVGCLDSTIYPNGKPFSNGIHYLYLDREIEGIDLRIEDCLERKYTPRIYSIVSRATERVVLLPDSHFDEEYIAAVDRYRKFLEEKKYKKIKHSYRD
jgi:hypothetical protein